MKRPFFVDAVGRIVLLIGGLLAATLLLTVTLASTQSAAASSHREAPLISKDPFADNTDVYAFIPPGQTDNIVLVASYIPFEGPEGGPNYFEFDDNVTYSINIDNNGDAVPDIRYVLTSSTTVTDPLTFLYNTAPIDALGDPDQNRQQRITVREDVAGSYTTLLDNVPVAPVNIGSKSTPYYDALYAAAARTVTAGGDDIQIFAGQTDDPFWVDLQIFDLLTLRGQASPIGINNANNVPIDSLSGFNVHSLVVEVPISRLTQGSEPVLGVWATASRKSQTIRFPGAQFDSGFDVQVSRLGMPLVNEVVLPYALKDAFNGLPPDADLAIYLDPTLGPIMQRSVEDPEVGRLLCQLYNVPLPGDGDDNCSTEIVTGTARSGRGDIFDIFLTGMLLENEFPIQTASGVLTLPVGFNINQPAGVVPAEMIRINTAISGTLCAPTPSRLGVLGGDACGFPNGRRLMDDVVDIEILAVAGAAYEALDARDASFTFDPSLLSVLDDGLDGNDLSFLNSFPYLAAPHAGEDHYHQNILNTALPIVIRSAQTVQQTAAENPIAATATLSSGLALLGLPLLLWRRRREDE